MKLFYDVTPFEEITPESNNPFLGLLNRAHLAVKDLVWDNDDEGCIIGKNHEGGLEILFSKNIPTTLRDKALESLVEIGVPIQMK